MGDRILALRREFDPADGNAEGAFGSPRELNEGLYKSLFKDTAKHSIVSSSPKVFSAIHKNDFTDNFYISEDELESYSQGLLDILTNKNIDAVLEEEANEAQIDLDDIALDDKDIKLSLYRSFKSIYDKWISNSGKSTQKTPTKGYFFNNYGQDDDRTLFDHFKFINRANSDIGGQAIIDPNMLSELISTSNGKGPTESLYQVITNILSKNNFDFWPTPANIPLNTNSLPSEELKKMFTALDRFEKAQSGPIFNCVFMGGSSRQLKDLNNKEGGCELINSEYGDDGFDITEPTEWPEEISGNLDSGLVVFKVRYGQEAQNHFQSLEVDQTNFKETQESLLVIDKLANPNQGNSPSQAGKGNNIYDLNLTRAYNCTVKGLGNMSIQPLMYFKLENVPMFRGTYLINNVKHTITAHKVETEFTGLRQPKVTIPVVEDPVSLLDLALSEEAIEGQKLGSLGTFGVVGSEFTSANVSQFTQQDEVEKGCEISKRLQVDLGLTLAQSAGVVGNLMAESSLIPDRIQGSGTRKGLITESGGWNGTDFSKGGVQGYGWAQWTYYTLKNSFITYANSVGVDLTTTPANDEVSYGYLVEWISKNSSKLNKLKTKTSAYEASKYFAQEYERCARCNEQVSWTKRGGYAQQVFDYCNSATSSPSSKTSNNVFLLGGLDDRSGDLDISQQQELLQEGLFSTVSNGSNQSGQYNISSFRYNDPKSLIKKIEQSTKPMNVVLFSAGCRYSNDVSSAMKIKGFNLSNLFIVEPYAKSSDTTKSVKEAVKLGVPNKNVIVGSSSSTGKGVVENTTTTPTCSPKHWCALTEVGKIIKQK